MWNCLPQDVVMSPVLDAFKKGVGQIDGAKSIAVILAYKLLDVRDSFISECQMQGSGNKMKALCCLERHLVGHSEITRSWTR